MKNWINKYKAEILIILGAIISICTSFATLDAKYATVSSVIIAIVAAIIGVIKKGITEESVNLIANAIYIIIKALKEEEDKNVVALGNELTVDEIKEMLVCELHK